MEVKKELQVASFQNWLITQDIMFIAKANGHFHIINTQTKKVDYQVWVTTEKMMDNPSNPIQQKCWLGMPNIKTELKNYRDRWIATPMFNDQSPLRERIAYVVAFCNPTERNKLVVGVELPTGATEVIINTENIKDKLNYYLTAYDNDMHLKTNKDIRLVDFMII